MSFRAIIGIVAFVVVLGSAAFADAPKAPPIHEGPKTSIQAYGAQNNQCREWTNGCTLCVKGDDGHSQCSLPGIACTPSGITCKRMGR